MKKNVTILILSFLCAGLCRAQVKDIHIPFYENSIQFTFNDSLFVDFNQNDISEESIQQFYTNIGKKNYGNIVNALLAYRQQNQPDDWLYYQLIRKTAQQISPKKDNYIRYTLYKFYLLQQTGYSPLLAINNNRILLYVESNDNVYNVPLRNKDGRQYVCLNYHDYGSDIDFSKYIFNEVSINAPDGDRLFSYKITHLPNFNTSDYVQKELQFATPNNAYSFLIKVNPQIKNIFINYPTLDYENYLGMPLSKGTYASLIPQLKKHLKGMSQKQGVDYLMQFTRYAFVFEPDTKQFGNEKRLTPEQTLLYENSDCEDRVIFFFTLVKEIYNLPMIVLAYPNHVTIAVNFNKKAGKPIMYEGVPYYICEPTPQKQDLRIGELLPELKNVAYQIAYAYKP